MRRRDQHGAGAAVFREKAGRRSAAKWRGSAISVRAAAVARPTALSRGPRSTGLVNGVGRRRRRRTQGEGATERREATVASRPKWPSAAIALVGLVAVLSGVGLVMVLSASSVFALRKHHSPWAVFERQAVWMVLGWVAMIVIARIDYRRWARLSASFLAITVFTLVLVVATPLGVSANGSTRWIGPSGLLVQPSEFAKLAVTLYLAWLLASRSHRIGVSRVTTRPAVFVTSAVLVLVILQPDLGTTIIIGVIAASVLLVADLPWADLAKTFGIGLVLTLVLAVVEPYRFTRLASFLAPDSDLEGTGFHLRQSLVGLGSGRVFGTGVGASRAKWGFLPNAHTDFIFSIIGEELGLLGSLLVIGLFVGLGCVGMQVARRAPDRFGTLCAVGLTTWIISQAVINIGAVIGVLPITGVPLPFVSVGGSSLVVIMAGIGVLLSIARLGVSPSQRQVAMARIERLPEVATDVRAGLSRHPATVATGGGSSTRTPQRGLFGRPEVGRGLGRHSRGGSRPNRNGSRPHRRTRRTAPRRVQAADSPRAVNSTAPRSDTSRSGTSRSDTSRSDTSRSSGLGHPKGPRW